MSRDLQDADRRDSGGSYTQRPARKEPERVTRDEDEERVERRPGRAREDAERRAGEEDDG